MPKLRRMGLGIFPNAALRRKLHSVTEMSQDTITAHDVPSRQKHGGPLGHQHRDSGVTKRREPLLEREGGCGRVGLYALSLSVTI